MQGSAFVHCVAASALASQMSECRKFCSVERGQTERALCHRFINFLHLAIYHTSFRDKP